MKQSKLAENTSKMLVILVLLTWGCQHEIDIPTQPPTPGRVVINEVLYDPVGANAGTQLVELKNVGSEPVDLNGWWFCARQDYAPIPSLTLAPGAVAVAHINVNGNDSDTDIYIPMLLPLQSVSDLNIYRNSLFTNPGSMVHYVQWGGVPPINRQSEAVSAGLWTAGDFVASVSEGHSIVYDGDGFSSTDWTDEANPTIGF